MSHNDYDMLLTLYFVMMWTNYC